MGTQYGVDITMSDETIEELDKNNFSLFAFKAVQSSQGGGVPVVWIKTQDYSQTTSVTWEENYQAYTSKTEIQAGATIRQSAAYSIDLGEVLHVTSDHGIGVVKQDGRPGVIGILDEVMTQFTCGLSQHNDTGYSPLCAFELGGTTEDQFIPVEKVLFTFASAPVVTSTVVEQSLATSILIDLTGATSRQVSYVWGKGWNWGSQAWAKEIPANKSIVGDLILGKVPQHV